MPGTTYHYSDCGSLELVATRGEERSYPWHAHTRHHIAGFVAKGFARLATGRCPARLFSSGESFFVRKGEPHSLNILPGSRLTVLCFDEKGLLERTAGPLLHACDRAFISAGELERLLRQVSRCFKSERSTACFAGVGENALLERSVRAVTGLLAAAPELSWSIEALAEYAGYSPWYFLRGFRNLTGMTPHLFQQVCRIRLLRAGLRADMAAAGLAASTGFSDQSHMHKVFKKHHGLTPKQFREASFKLEL